MVSKKALGIIFLDLATTNHNSEHEYIVIDPTGIPNCENRIMGGLQLYGIYRIIDYDTKRDNKIDLGEFVKFYNKYEQAQNLASVLLPVISSTKRAEINKLTGDKKKIMLYKETRILVEDIKSRIKNQFGDKFAFLTDADFTFCVKTANVYRDCRHENKRYYAPDDKDIDNNMNFGEVVDCLFYCLILNSSTDKSGMLSHMSSPCNFN